MYATIDIALHLMNQAPRKSHHLLLKIHLLAENVVGTASHLSQNQDALAEVAREANDALICPR
jgi:hypothetical protein